MQHATSSVTAAPAAEGSQSAPPHPQPAITETDIAHILQVLQTSQSEGADPELWQDAEDQSAFEIAWILIATSLKSVLTLNILSHSSPAPQLWDGCNT